MKEAYCLVIFLTIGMHTFAVGSKPGWVWAKSGNGMRDDEVNSISLDASGNTYVTGYFSSPIITFGNTILFNADSSGKTADIFIAKYDQSGNLIWAKSIGGSGIDKGWGVSTDASGNAYVTGVFSSQTLSFGTNIIRNAKGGSSDAFIAKYDKSGNSIWAKSFGGPEEESAFSVCADAMGNSYITGYYFSQTIAFDAVLLKNSDSTHKSANIFTAKLSPSGFVLWAASINGSGQKNKSRSVCNDAHGNTYITGSYSGSSIAEGIAIEDKENAGKSKNIFVAKYDDSGTLLWINIASGTGKDEGGGISTDSDGNAYMTGLFTSPVITLGNITMINKDSKNESADFVIAKYNSLGKVLWAKSAGGYENDWGHSISTDKYGNSYVAGGSFSNCMVLGTDTLFNPGGREQSVILIAKFDANGNAVWAQTPVGNVDNGEGRGISQNLSGAVSFGGTFFSSSVTFNNTLINADRTGVTCDIFVTKLGKEQTKASISHLTGERTQTLPPDTGKPMVNVVKDSIIRKIANNMVLVEGGAFTMGCTTEQGDDCNADEKPDHQVKIGSFKICKYDVSQAEWQAVMGNNPSEFKNCAECPVENVSWTDAMTFIGKLNKATNKNYRLPTEAEWEYAARGGNSADAYKYAGSNDINAVAWYDGNSEKKTHPLGKKLANELGLFDMSGNVWQWCSDWYEGTYFADSPRVNPKGPESGMFKVARGGSWFFTFSGSSRVTIRNWCSPSNRLTNLGFRLAEDF